MAPLLGGLDHHSDHRGELAPTEDGIDPDRGPDRPLEIG